MSTPNPDSTSSPTEQLQSQSLHVQELAQELVDDIELSRLTAEADRQFSAVGRSLGSSRWKKRPTPQGALNNNGLDKPQVVNLGS